MEPETAAQIPQVLAAGHGELIERTTTPAGLLTYALSNGAGIETLERLMKLQLDWEANEARKAFHAAVARFKLEPDLVIMKRKLVQFETNTGDDVSYMHAELSDITDVLGPKLALHGLSYDWELTQEPNLIRVTCVLSHALGHSKRVTLQGAPDNSGKKNAIQQVQSTITYLERGTLLAITGMSTKGMDDDGAGGSQPVADNPDGMIDPNAAWRDAIEACSTPRELAARKRELVDSCGGADKVPAALQALCVKMKKQLEEK